MDKMLLWRQRKMTYNAVTRELRASDGSVLKRLSCPLTKQWQHLKVISNLDDKRHCDACGKNVCDLSQLSEKEVRALLKDNRNACIHIASDAQNIIIEGSSSPVLCPAILIRTARTTEAINYAVRNGFRAVIVKVDYSNKIRSRYAVFQNITTGEISTVSHNRFTWSAEWKVIIPMTWYYPNPPSAPFAAYLLPPEIQVGDRCYLEDIIEDIVGEIHNNQDVYRMKSGFAIWDGERMVIAEKPVSITVMG